MNNIGRGIATAGIWTAVALIGVFAPGGHSEIVWVAITGGVATMFVWDGA